MEISLHTAKSASEVRVLNGRAYINKEWFSSPKGAIENLVRFRGHEYALQIRTPDDSVIFEPIEFEEE